MTRKEYDFAFSLGWSCGCTQALRLAGCQYASYPIDWLGSPNLQAGVDVICNDFARWLEPDDLRLVDVSHDAGFGTRIYLNDYTGMGFSHEFSDFQKFEKTYPSVKASYDHRIARFLDMLKGSRRMVAVYIEHAERARLTDGALAQAAARLRGKYPNATIELIYFYEDATCPAPRIVSETDGVMVVAFDYQKIEEGQVTQYIKVEEVAQFLRARIAVVDSRTDADRQKFAAERQKVGNGRWGYDKSAYRRWLNQRAYKLYRHLERVLRQKKLIHPKRVIQLWDERWFREHGEVAS